jgi:tetratricopeptide (TPR) repeat protein
LNRVSPATRVGERRFFIASAIAILLLFFAGFARSYYPRAWLSTRVLAPILHLHGLIMSAWIALFIVQIALVSRYRIRLHRRLGLELIAPLFPHMSAAWVYPPHGIIGANGLAESMSTIQQAQALHRGGRLDDARTLCEELLREQPGSFEALSLLALIAAQQGDFALAVAGYDRVIAFNPDSADAYSNRGASLAGLNRWNEALSNFDRAIAICPGHAEAHFSRAVLWLLQGDFARGWAEFEWRWKTTDGRALRERKRFPQPLWLGTEALAGKTILLYCERGLGDTLQFCRFAKLVRDLGVTVFLQVQEALVEMLSQVEGASQVFAETQPPPPFDLQCPLLSLPLALKIELATIPGGKYLSAPLAASSRWRSKLGGATKPRIGLVWRGDPDNPDDRKRSLVLAELLAHLPVGFQYLSLQKELTELEQRTVNAHPVDFSGWQELNFVETAALCECLDLVISVDTSVAHLSAALGRKTWILLPSNPDCRWQLDRHDSPWYVSARLYRQSRAGDWDGVLARVAADLTREFAPGAPL